MNKKQTKAAPKKPKSKKFPEIFLDKKNGFTSIKLASGIETKSYIKRGFVFSENENGEVIEIQILKKNP